jgi:hypothetical protein
MFAYNLRFRRVIACWKGIVNDIHFGYSMIPLDIIENLNLEKPSFGPSKLSNNCFEPIEKGG